MRVKQGQVTHEEVRARQQGEGGADRGAGGRRHHRRAGARRCGRRVSRTSTIMSGYSFGSHSAPHLQKNPSPQRDGSKPAVPPLFPPPATAWRRTLGRAITGAPGLSYCPRRHARRPVLREMRGIPIDGSEASSAPNPAGLAPYPGSLGGFAGPYYSPSQPLSMYRRHDRGFVTRPSSAIWTRSAQPGSDADPEPPA